MAKRFLNCSWSGAVKTVRAGVILLGLLPGALWAQGRIIQESKCLVRIEGNAAWSAGQRLQVVRPNNGRQEVVAVLEVTKPEPPNRAIGKLVSANVPCNAVMGLTVMASSGAGAGVSSGGGAGGGASGAAGGVAPPSGANNLAAGRGKKAGTTLPKVLIDVMGGYNQLSSAGLHRQVGLKLDTLTFYGFGFGIEAYPLAFTGSGLVQNGLGLGLKYRYGNGLVEVSDVSQPTAVVAKETFTQSDLRFDGIFRVGFAGESMAAMGKLGYMSHSFTNKFQTQPTGTGAPTDPYLRDISYSGLVVGLGADLKPISSLRIHGEVGFPVGLSGSIDASVFGSTTGAEVKEMAKVKTASGLLADVTGEYDFDWLRFIGGFSYLNYKGTVDLKDQSTTEVQESYMMFLVGAGVVF